MRTPPKTAFLLGVLAALLWSPHFYLLKPLIGPEGGLSPLVVQFHVLFWPAVLLVFLMFISGRASALKAVSQRETRFLFLAGAGGYGFWVLRGLALEAPGGGHVHLLFYTAPLLMAFFGLFGRQKGDRRSAAGLLLGFVGCILLARGLGGAGPAEGGTLSADLLALGAAACWALFTVLAVPMVREQSVLPVTALVTAVGAACLLVTCLGRGEAVLIFAVSFSQLRTLALTGVVTVGLMMALWLKFVGSVPLPLAAPFWYLGLMFGVFWAGRVGVEVATWWTLAGVIVLLPGLHVALGGRERSGITISDIIRGGV
jgi:drug/metabolite transporter (DMT)-like permease